MKKNKALRILYSNWRNTK